MSKKCLKRQWEDSMEKEEREDEGEMTKKYDKGGTCARRMREESKIYHSMPLSSKETFVPTWNAASVGKWGVKWQGVRNLTRNKVTFQQKYKTGPWLVTTDSSDCFFFILEKSLSLQFFGFFFFFFKFPVSILELSSISTFREIYYFLR